MKVEDVDAHVEVPVTSGPVTGRLSIPQGTSADATLPSAGLYDSSGRSSMQPMTEAKWKTKYVHDTRSVPNHSGTNRNENSVETGNIRAPQLSSITSPHI